MKHRHKTLAGALVVAALAAALALIVAGNQGAMAEGTIIYVDADARGRDDGTTWRNAYTDLQAALGEAEPYTQIWVAAGTYKPSHEFIQGDPRSASFQMVNGVAVYGGFEPDEGVTKFEDRDWVAHVTILSGNIGNEDRSDDNSYHVFYHPPELALNGSAILDGFTITGGNANEPDYPGGVCGGGAYNEGSSPTLRNITLLNNSAGYGGALWVSAPVPEEMTVILTNVTFVGNSAAEGGGAYIDATEADPGDWELTFANCIFRGNVAERGGGVLVTQGEPDADTPPIRFANCTFWGNGAESGGGIYVSKGPGEGWLMLTNSILWGDTAGGLPDEIHAEDPDHPPIVTFSDVQGGYGGEGNIEEYPEFVEPDSGNLHLQPGSPCIDLGSNGAPDMPMIDFEGDDRILDGDGDEYAVVDMGADEVEYPYPVEISVTPYIPTNVIRLRPGVVVDVAILSTADFDAVAQVAPDTVEFAGAPHVGFTFEDVNGDGRNDVLLDFMAEDMVDLNEDSTEATLTGVTHDKTDFEGTAEVKVR